MEIVPLAGKSQRGAQHPNRSSTLFRVLLSLSALCLASCAGERQFVGERPPLTERQRDAALKALLGPERFAEYVTITDTTESREWLRRFWTDHDPTPTTPENEFQIDHERRVYHAIYLFGTGGKGGPPWDDRGEVYIRYGQPDERLIRRVGPDGDEVIAPGGRGGGRDDDPFMTPLNTEGAASEVWTYYRWDQSFQFEDKRGFGFYELVPVTDPEARRQDMGEFYASRLRAIDLQPAIYYHEYGRNLIDYALDVVRFRGEGRHWRVDVNLGYPLSELGRDSDSASISLRRTLVVRDQDQREVFGEEGLIHRLVGPVGPTHQLMVEQKTIDLPPGRFALAVTINDLCTGKTGTYIKTFRLPAYIVPEVQEISDIEMASFVWSIYEPGSLFVRGDHMVMPLPSRVYLPDQSLAFYFEVYNLLLDKQGKTQYEVSYVISAADGTEQLHQVEPGTLSSSTRQVSRVGTLDISTLPAGEYVLTIRVNDLVGKHERIALASFRKSD
ncbi:MAG: GWxTD domain-containing protein [Candidatus Zixiibacteriota bacterium]